MAGFLWKRVYDYHKTTSVQSKESQPGLKHPPSGETDDAVPEQVAGGDRAFFSAAASRPKPPTATPPRRVSGAVVPEPVHSESSITASGLIATTSRQRVVADAVVNSFKGDKNSESQSKLAATPGDARKQAAAHLVTPTGTPSKGNVAASTVLTVPSWTRTDQLLSIEDASQLCLGKVDPESGQIIEYFRTKTEAADSCNERSQFDLVKRAADEMSSFAGFLWKRVPVAQVPVEKLLALNFFKSRSVCVAKLDPMSREALALYFSASAAARSCDRRTGHTELLAAIEICLKDFCGSG